MSALSGKKILLGISGGIAAYKTATLVRLFIKAGAHVQVIMTPASKDFITPLTLSTLSKNPVFSSFYNTNMSHSMLADSCMLKSREWGPTAVDMVSSCVVLYEVC